MEKKFCGTSKFPTPITIKFGAAVISKGQTGCIYVTQLNRKTLMENKIGMLLTGAQGLNLVWGQ